jgi:hypothetical protein
MRPFLALFALTLLACSSPAANPGILCAGEGGAPGFGHVAWPRALILAEQGGEVGADVISVGEDGTAQLMISGYADAPGAGHPDAALVSVPCLAWAGAGALRRPGGVVWAFPTTSPSTARVGIFAGAVGALVRVAVSDEGSVDALELPEVTAPSSPSWIFDPSTPLIGDASAAWASACRAP